MRNASERNVERFRSIFDFMLQNKENQKESPAKLRSFLFGLPYSESARVDDKIWKLSKGHTE